MRPTLKLRQEQALENTVLGFPSGRSVKVYVKLYFSAGPGTFMDNQAWLK